MEQEELSPQERELARYVSDTRGDVYSIEGIPEEILAVVFAYVSRSPRSFRQNLLEVSQERAESFHRKWVLEYGHASVAEHAVLHLGVENISRYASAVLEESRLISVTEYSQRYQEPVPEAVHMPAELAEMGRADEVRRHFRQSYDSYLRLLEGMITYLGDLAPRRRDEAEDAYHRRLRRMAFEDARYVLPLATTSSLGLTVNARQLEYVIGKLRSHPARELATLGNALRDAALKVTPTLVRYADPILYLSATRDRARRALCEFERDLPGPTDALPAVKPAVKLVDYTGRSTGTERDALTRVLTTLLIHAGDGEAEFVETRLADMSEEELADLFRRLVDAPGAHDPIPRALEMVTYTFDVRLSEAAWHQLLRHRMMSSFPAEPRTDRGITVPPRVREAGLESLFAETIEHAEKLWQEVQPRSPIGAIYLTTNAHHRFVRIDCDLRQFYHLANLRLSKKAQWDIRGVVGAMQAEIRRVHPNLISPADGRGGASSVPAP